MPPRERIGAVIPCRLDSTRLPRKVLRRVRGRALLDRVLDRCRGVAGLDLIVVATTDRAVDDPIADHAAAQGVLVYRGRLDDVGQRLLGAARAHDLDWIARVNADSPFVDPRLLEAAIATVRAGSVDFVTNLHPRTFPYGVSVELVRTQVYERLVELREGPEERDHPTQVLYRLVDRLRVRRIHKPGPPAGHLRLTIDAPGDLEWFGRMLDVMAKRGLSWERTGYEDAVALLQEGAVP